MPVLMIVIFAFPFSYARKLEQLVRYLIQPSPGQKDAILYDYDDPQLAPLHRAFEKRNLFISRLSREAEQEVLRQAQMKLPLEP